MQRFDSALQLNVHSHLLALGAGPPGMCPGVTVEGGGTTGAGGGGGGGGGKGGKGGKGANADGANGGKQGAPDPAKYPECGTASHPVDVVTGRAFTHPIEDLELEGPLPLAFERIASSFACRRDFGLGWTWGHTLGWEVEIRRTVTRVWSDTGRRRRFFAPRAGARPRRTVGLAHPARELGLRRRHERGPAPDHVDRGEEGPALPAHGDRGQEQEPHCLCVRRDGPDPAGGAGQRGPHDPREERRRRSRGAVPRPEFPVARPLGRARHVHP